MIKPTPTKTFMDQIKLMEYDKFGKRMGLDGQEKESG
jgi:hypothetical protein